MLIPQLQSIALRLSHCEQDTFGHDRPFLVNMG
jgi:hypothetical protein